MSKRFSFYLPPVDRNQTPDNSLSLEDIFKYIRGEGAKSRTEEIRRAIERGDDPKPLKKGLDFVTFGGIFDYRNISDTEKLYSLGKKGLLLPSGYMTIDLDHLTGAGFDLQETRKILLERRNEIGLRLLFTSPSGDGLKLVCESVWGIESPEDYKSSFYSLAGYIHEKFSLPYSVRQGERWIPLLDLTPDITRTCFLDYDPEAVLLEDSIPFNPEEYTYPESLVNEERRIERGESPSPQKRGERDLPSPIGETWDSFMETLRREIFQRVDTIFPDMRFTYTGNGWKSPLKWDGSPAKNPRLDKCVITSRFPDKVFEQGETSPKGTVDFYMEKNGLTFPEALSQLSEICGLGDRLEGLRRKTAESKNKDHRDNYRTMLDKSPYQTDKPSTEEDFSHFFNITPLSELAKRARRKEGIKTKYVFSRDGEKENLTLPSGALTLVCGKSSHGKSKFLQNLALQVARDGEEGGVLFMTYEESLESVTFQFANLYIADSRDREGLFSSDAKISKYGTRNTEVIMDYFEGGDLPRCPQEKIPSLKLSLENFNRFYESGKLRILFPDLESGLLSELIRKGVSEYGVRAVFIDYVQLLEKYKGRKERNQELKEICKDLQGVAIETGVPIVLASQLNRETPNPLDMSGDNIADSADITRYANSIVLLWNSVFTDMRDTSFINSKEDNLRLKEKGFILGEPGKIYARLGKNRGGTPQLETILDFQGETGYIRPNIEERTETEGEKDRPLFGFNNK